MRILMVCTGNICRSVMAERILQHALDERGLKEVEVISAGISDEERGNPIDPRAVQILQHQGYRTEDHAAQQVTEEMVKDSDLVLAMTKQHAKALNKIAKSAGLSKPERQEKIRVYREFGTAAPEDGNYDINDPWYGDMEDFIETLDNLEDGLEGVLTHINAHNHR